MSIHQRSATVAAAFIALVLLVGAAFAQHVQLNAPSAITPLPPPAGRILARMDCSLGWPSCGLDNWSANPSPYYTMTQLPNGTRFTFLPVTTPNQPYLGWLATLPADTGNVIYVRLHFTVHPPFRANGVGDVWSSKFMIVNQGGDPRVISQLKPFASPNNDDLGWTTTIGIGSEGAPRIPLTFGNRLALQLKVMRGTGVTFAQWVNNPNCAAPTTISAPLNFTAALTNIGVGFYSNATMSSSGSISFSIEDVVIGTACDPTFT